jgi:aspartokinase
MEPEKQGTLILSEDQVQKRVKSISFKENMTVVTYFQPICSLFGFLTRLFEVFGKYGIRRSISTSDVNVTLTVDPK